MCNAIVNLLDIRTIPPPGCFYIILTHLDVMSSIASTLNCISYINVVFYMTQTFPVPFMAFKVSSIAQRGFLI